MTALDTAYEQCEWALPSEWDGTSVPSTGVLEVGNQAEIYKAVWIAAPPASGVLTPEQEAAYANILRQMQYVQTHGYQTSIQAQNVLLEQHLERVVASGTLAASIRAAISAAMGAVAGSLAGRVYLKRVATVPVERVISPTGKVDFATANQIASATEAIGAPSSIPWAKVALGFGGLGLLWWVSTWRRR